MLARRVGSVQKQNTSGRSAIASSRASVDFAATPSLAAAASSRACVDVADAGHFEPAVGLEGGGMVHAPLAHAPTTTTR